MGVEPFLIASTLNCVESQRLVRKICPHCKEPVEVDPEYLVSLGIDPAELDGTIYKGKGCSHCHRTGYRGRTGIFEVLPVTPQVREMILDRATTDELYEAAEKEGMVSLRKAALRKLKEGIIDLDEVIRETIEQ
jgi:type IV pilus assembly protein PilB